MKKTLSDVLKDIETELIGKTLHGISGNASVFSVAEVDYENNNVVLDVQGKRKTWTFDRLEKVWNEMYYRPAANVEVVFGGSGSSRNQVETIFANLAYVLWLNINAKKCIAYVGEPVHPYGEIARMDEKQEEEYNALMMGDNPYNPLLDPNEIPEATDQSAKLITDAIRDDYSIDELGTILKKMYESAENGMQVCSIHVFGIKYGKCILKNSYKSAAIIKAADMNESYNTELSKAINIYKALEKNSYGISFASQQQRTIVPGKKTGAENVLLYGVPGAGKSHMIKQCYCNDRTKMERVVFHPDYTYSDFVGQILPRVVAGQLKYEFVSGPFTAILKKALNDPQSYYYLVIEEINRGNAPAIFGEIFQLLDRKNSGEYPDEEVGESEYGITNFDIARAVYGDETQEVYIPSNMWILATMNTADQNVFTLDTAFQRRWNMKHIDNNVLQAKHASTLIAGSSIDWGTFASVVNDLMLEANSEIGNSEDKRLGAYFVGLRELQADRFPEKVLKYLWDDAFKMSHDFIFTDGMKSLECVIETYQKSSNDRLRSVLRAEVYNKMISNMMNAKNGASSDASAPVEDTEKQE